VPGSARESAGVCRDRGDGVETQGESVLGQGLTSNRRHEHDGPRRESRSGSFATALASNRPVHASRRCRSMTSLQASRTLLASATDNRSLSGRAAILGLGSPPLLRIHTPRPTPSRKPYAVGDPHGGLRMQRRLRDCWALKGPSKEVRFPQKHHPGERGALDFTCCNELEVTIGGQLRPGLGGGGCASRLQAVFSAPMHLPPALVWLV